MHKFLFLFLSIACFGLPNQAHTKQQQHYLTLCAVFQDEAPYLKEWIEYHHLLGVEHFYLYNNNSHDDYKKILNPYIKKKWVTLIDWPSPDASQDWTPHQVKAYNDCLSKVKNTTRWLAVIDLDEYIVPVIHDNLPDLLRNYDEAGGIQIFWQFFGTSDVYDIPKGKTLIETLVMKAPKDSGINYNCKSICQPARVKEYKVHGAIYTPPWFAIFPHGTRGGAHQPIHIDIVRIHHYWTRDERHFREKKVPRRARLEGNRSEEQIQKTIQDLNQVEDTTILRFVPRLRARLGLKN